MAIYEERLYRDLTQIRESVLVVGEKVLQAYKNSVHALLTGNHNLAKQVILGDEVINTALHRIDERCHKFIAIHLPSGAHLRTISSIIRANIEIERIGDYAVTISRESIQFDTPIPKELAVEVERIADTSTRTLQLAMESFKQNNADMALATKKMTKAVESVFEGILDRLVATCKQNPEATEDMFRLMHVFTKIIRVADQASNICTEIMFAVAGTQRIPRAYRIWFIDERNTLSKIAETIGHKLYPKSAEYWSFGSVPVPNYDPILVEFLKQKGVILDQERPRIFDFSAQELQNLGENQIIVSLHGPIKQYVSPLNTLERIPYRIVVLEWDIKPVPENLDPLQLQQCYEERYREIASKVSELVQTFKGEEAA
jgi:phosphate transport system protein